MQAGGHEFESRILHLIIISAADMADVTAEPNLFRQRMSGHDIGGYSENIRERKTYGFELSSGTVVVISNVP